MKKVFTLVIAITWVALSTQAQDTLLRTDLSWVYSNDEESGWQYPDFDDSGWSPVLNLGGTCFPQCDIGGDHYGNISQLPYIAYMRRTFVVNGNFDQVLMNTSEDDDVEVYINGSLAFVDNNHLAGEYFNIDVTAFIKSNDTNVIAVKHTDFYCCGYAFGLLIFSPGGCTTPTASITPLGNLDICNTGFVKLQASSGIGYTYQWNRNNIDMAEQVYQTLKAKKPGNYRVRISTGPGCAAISKKMVVYSSCKLGEETELTSSLNVFPNPTSGNFTLDLQLDDEETSQAQLQIVNMFGQIVYSENEKIESGRLLKEIQLSDAVAEGMYLVKVMINNQVFTSQINYQK